MVVPLRADAYDRHLERRSVDEDLRAIRVALAQGQAPLAALILTMILNRRSVDLLIELAQYVQEKDGVQLRALEELKTVRARALEILGG